MTAIYVLDILLLPVNGLTNILVDTMCVDRIWDMEFKTGFILEDFEGCYCIFGIEILGIYIPVLG